MASEAQKRNTIFPGSRGWSDHFDNLTSSSPRSQGSLLSGQTVLKSRDSKKNRFSNRHEEEYQPEESGAVGREDRESTPGSKVSAVSVTKARKIPVIKAHEVVAATSKPPGKEYRKLYKLQFGDSPYFSVAQDANSSQHGQLVIIQKLFGNDTEDQVRSIRQIRHPRFLVCQEMFSLEGSSAIAFEFMPLSLAELAGNPLLDELILASILGQILDGLSYLERNGLEHGRLSCSNILLDQSGNVKIWGYERSQPSSRRGRDIKSLSSILMELMQGYTKEDGAVGIDDLSRWPSDSRAIDFLSMTTSATEISQLFDHPLLQLSWHPSLLEGVVSMANIWASRGYKYLA